MNIHEYQAKNLLRAYGVGVLNGYLVEEIGNLECQARKIETDVAVIKAQIHAGGRGKAGGVKVVKTLDEAVAVGTQLLGSKLVTHQTGPEGKRVNKIYIEEGCSILQEFYLSLLVDRGSGQVAIVASREGGVEIEEVAKMNPESIVKLYIDPAIGIKAFHTRRLANLFELDNSQRAKLSFLLIGLYNCLIEMDLDMAEINPLVLTESGDLIALDAKMSFDDNALFRHKEVEQLRDLSEENQKETEAAAVGLSYIALEGEIGCLVNGAGLAMATMDAIHHAGGTPANFLDVGGSANTAMVARAFDIILSDEKVKGIFVNIFGGIMHCDTIARGIIEAAKTFKRQVPIVVRLEGTNVDRGQFFLEQSGLNFKTVKTMDEGAEAIVKMILEQNAPNESKGMIGKENADEHMGR